MDKNLFESLVINCLKHGDFSVSKDIYEKKEESNNVTKLVARFKMSAT